MSLHFSEKSHRYKMTLTPGKVDERRKADGSRLNPYAPVSGATTLISGGVPKPALTYWAARTVAEYVMDNPREIELIRDEYVTGDRYAAVRKLARTPDLVRDAAADRGHMIHEHAQHIIAGHAVDIPDEILAETMGFINAIDAFGIDALMVETSVGNRRHWYAGRFDAIGTSTLFPGETILFDWKSSNNVYGETALQTAAYAKAEFYVTDDEPHVEIPMPKIDRTIVAHITKEGTKLYTLAADPDQIARHHELFVAAAFTHKTAKERDAIIGEPLTIPALPESEITA